MNELVSVIVPVYKVEEKLLRRSIESILTQSYSNLEILIVDDGSPDNSGIICDEYSKADKRVKVFHIENEGVSAARNYALERAEGDFIFFVDSDDFIELSAIECMVRALINENADCVMCAASHIYEDAPEKETALTEKIESKTFNQKEAVEALCYMECPFEDYEFGAVWGSLYKKSVVNNIRFNRNMQIGEDFEFKFRVFMNIEKLVCLNAKFYNYLIRHNSAMRNGFNPFKPASVNELQKMLDSKKISSEYYNAFLSRAVNIAIVVLSMIPVDKQYKEYREPIKDFLRKSRASVIKNPKTRKKVKISLIMSYLGFDFVQKLFFAGEALSLGRRKDK